MSNSQPVRRSRRGEKHTFTPGDKVEVNCPWNFVFVASVPESALLCIARIVLRASPDLRNKGTHLERTIGGLV